MATTAARKPNSRETREPRRTKTGRDKVADVTPRDAAVWRRVFIDAGYPVARLNTIHAFMGEDGGNYEALQRHYDALSREPNCYIYRHTQQWANVRAYGRSTVYGLDRNGFDYLRVPAQKAPRNLEHELMWCEHAQSVQLGAITHGIPFADRASILNSPNLPASTRSLPDPFEIPVRRHGEAGTSRADGSPFGIGLQNPEGSYTWRFFFTQADCDSEPISAKDNDRPSIDRHMRSAIYILEHELYYKQFGFPLDECYFIFITPSAAHLENFKAHLRDLTRAKEKQWLREFFLFQTFPTYMSREQPSAHTGEMFTRAYDRVDWQPFSFLKL